MSTLLSVGIILAGIFSAGVILEKKFTSMSRMSDIENYERTIKALRRELEQAEARRQNSERLEREALKKCRGLEAKDEDWREAVNFSEKLINDLTSQQESLQNSLKEAYQCHSRYKKECELHKQKSEIEQRVQSAFAGAAYTAFGAILTAHVRTESQTLLEERAFSYFTGSQYGNLAERYLDDIRACNSSLEQFDKYGIKLEEYDHNYFNERLSALQALFGLSKTEMTDNQTTQTVALLSTSLISS